MHNRGSDSTPEELMARAVTAIAREWGISETEAAAAIERARCKEQRLGEALARAQTWDEAADG